MAELMMIDLKALLVEREDCDAGTMSKVREALSQGGTQYRSLRDVTDALRKRLENAQGPARKKWHLKLAVALYYLGHTAEAIEHLRQAEGGLANFLLGKLLAARNEYAEALEAFDRARKANYNSDLVDLQLVGIYRAQGQLDKARAALKGLQKMAHTAEYHYQLACLHLAEGERQQGIEALEKAVQIDPGHTAALFQLGHAADLSGNDEDAIGYYERALKYPPIHIGTLKNLGILYEDKEMYDKAVECFRRVLTARPHDEQARLYLKDAEASLTMHYDPGQEKESALNKQVMEIPVTDFELSVRSRNCLKKMNIKTLGDVTRVSREQLLSSKNFGETSLAEIEEMLASKGLRLGQSLEQGQRHERRFPTPQMGPVSEQEAAILNKPVSELNLSVRARKCMTRLGINTLGELTHRTADELLEAKNFGQTSLNEVREKLAAYGLHLRGE